MSRNQLLWFLDRAPRIASLLGLLGLAGLVRPELASLSALSFLSYLAFFRFFRRFNDPGYGPTAQEFPLLLLALGIAIIAPWLMALSPLFGLLGCAGWLALFDRAPAPSRHV